MEKIAYIIPGFGESASQKKYLKIAEYFRSRGIKPIPVRINWKRRTLSDYVNEFLEKHRHLEKQKVYLLGFSFGSMISLIASSRIKPKALLLCSLSPYFKEDLGYLKKWWKNVIGSRRMKNFDNHSFDKIAKMNSSPVVLFAGEKEPKQVMRRAKDAIKKLRRSELIIVEGVKHDIAQKAYQEAIEKAISKL